MCVALLYYSYFHFYCAAYHYLLIYHIDTPDYNTKCGSKQANASKSHSSPRLPHHLNSKKKLQKKRNKYLHCDPRHDHGDLALILPLRA